MDYKKIIGYGKKKKAKKEQPEPKVNKVLESIKGEFGYKESINEINFEKVVIPSKVKRFLDRFVDSMKDAQLNRIRRSAILYKVIKASGMSPKTLMADIQKIKKGLGKEGVNEGPAGDYEPYIHAIDQNYKKYWDSVKMFQKQLAKKGMKKEANNVHGFYTKLVSKFHSWFGKFVRKLM